MKEQEEKRRYRARIQMQTQKIREEEVFQSPEYLELLRSISRELTNGRLDTIRLYSDPAENSMGRCDGQRILLNLGNRVTESFLGLLQKNLSLVGVLGHECGHKNYSDFGLREKYISGILNGIWYPHPPEAENLQEEQNLNEIRGYFERKDPGVLSLIAQVAAYLNNLLEDIYIEEKMCIRFPGSIKRGILLNRERNIEWLPTLRELLEEKEDPVSILMNLCCQYAFSGRINNWDQEEHELLALVEELMPVIQNACIQEESSVRIYATNRIILKIWKYLSEIIREMEQKQQESEKENENEPDETKDNKKEETTASSSESDEAQENSKDATAMQQYLDHLSRRLPQFIQDEPKSGIVLQEAADENWGGSWERTEQKSENDAMQQTEGDEEGISEDPKQAADVRTENAGKPKETEKIPAAIRLIDADGPVQQILYQLAKENVDRQINQEWKHLLQMEIDETDFEDGHAKVKKKICRETFLSPKQQNEYQSYEEQVKKLQHRLYAALIPILRNQGKRMERRLFLGTKIDQQSIADPKGAIYKKTYPGKKVDMAVAVLIDMSGSMSGIRIEQSKVAALCLYEFCKKAGIAVSVYGHHTDGYRHPHLEDETVFLHCCAEFEPDAEDRYRIALLQPAGANRDGVALRFMGKKLLKRPEKQKLLVVISDGLPNSNQYSGKKAQEDLATVKKDLQKNGILCLAAAIGNDKERIKEIYQEAFLDISDLEKLPMILTKQIVKYIRRGLR